MRFYTILLSLAAFSGLGLSPLLAEERPIQNWLLCGPFLKADLETECFPDEGAVTPKEGDYSAGKLWKKYGFVKDSFDLEEAPAFGYQDQAVGYAYVEILAKREGWLELLLGSDDGIKVWWNGRIALVHPMARALTVGEDRVNLKLEKGQNRLLIKINDLYGGWAFSAKLAVLEGVRMEDLEFNPTGILTDRLPVKKARASTVQGRDEAQFSPKFAVDGDLSTRWSSEHYAPQWYEIYFGQPMDLARVDLYWENAYASEYKLATSLDGKHWEDLFVQFQGDGGHEIVISNPPRKVTALRFFGKKRGSEWGMSFWELEAYGWPPKDVSSFYESLPSIESEVARPYPVQSVSASSEQAPNPSKDETFSAANVVDHNTKTRWGSAFTDPQIITLDLGEPREIHQIVLFWETAFAKEYTVEISMDNALWETVFSTKEEQGGQRLIFFDNVKEARYVRMVGTARATTWGYSLWEFQVF